MKDRENQERVKHALELKEYSMFDLPGYKEWGEKHLDKWAALIAHLDARAIIMHPSDLAGPHEELFEEMLEELKCDFGITEE